MRKKAQGTVPGEKTIGNILLHVLGYLICLAVTAWLLALVAKNAGRVKPVLRDIPAAPRIEDWVAKARTEAVSQLYLSEGELPAPRVIYTIEDSAAAAPEPNPACYGQTTDPAALKDLLSRAEDLLGSEKLYFDPTVERFEDTPVGYYLDESIFAVSWKEVHDECVYTFSEVKIAHPSQFRRHLAGGGYGGDIQYLPTEMASSVNAVVASSGDFYRFRNFGVVAYDGKVHKVRGEFAETCFVDRSGDLHFTHQKELITVDESQQYVDDNSIRFSLAFGPILVEHGAAVEHSNYFVGEILDHYPRAALCQMGNLHYLIAAANVEGSCRRLPTVAKFAEHIRATGCDMAYCLDGGQTASIIMMDDLVNLPGYGGQRKMSDIIYFATAVPEETWMEKP